jgi:hypothetical protein
VERKGSGRFWKVLEGCGMFWKVPESSGKVLEDP